MNISALIDVFRMNEISPNTRAKVIIALGRAINDSFAMNITEAIVFELVSILAPENPILTDAHYLRFITSSPDTNRK